MGYTGHIPSISNSNDFPTNKCSCIIWISQPCLMLGGDEARNVAKPMPWKQRPFGYHFDHPLMILGMLYGITFSILHNTYINIYIYIFIYSPIPKLDIDGIWPVYPIDIHLSSCHGAHKPASRRARQMSGIISFRSLLITCQELGGFHGGSPAQLVGFLDELHGCTMGFNGKITWI